MHRFLRFDERQDAVFSLRFFRELLPKVRDNPQYWKWVMVALHSALQGFMVLALQGSDKLPIISDYKKARHIWAQYFLWLLGLRVEEVNNLPAPHLKKFSELYECIKCEKLMCLSASSRAFVPDGRHDESVKNLDEIRNQFIHFFPKFSSEDALEFITVASGCLEVISFIAFKSSNIIWHPPDLESETRELIFQLEDELTTLAQTVEGFTKTDT